MAAKPIQSLAEMRAALVAIATDLHRRLYLDTSNPIHVWAAYVQARKLRARELPAWITDYFDETARRLIAPGGTKSPKATAAALGLETRGGGKTARDRAVTAKQHVAIRDMVRAKHARGRTVTDAMLDVEAETGLSYETIREIRNPPRKRRKGGKLTKSAL